jgi:hypothetical protein
VRVGLSRAQEEKHKISLPQWARRVPIFSKRARTPIRVGPPLLAFTTFPEYTFQALNIARQALPDFIVHLAVQDERH